MQYNVPEQYVLVLKMYGTVWYNKVPKIGKNTQYCTLCIHTVFKAILYF